MASFKYLKGYHIEERQELFSLVPEQNNQFKAHFDWTLEESANSLMVEPISQSGCGGPFINWLLEEASQPSLCLWCFDLGSSTGPFQLYSWVPQLYLAPSNSMILSRFFLKGHGWSKKILQ